MNINKEKPTSPSVGVDANIMHCLRYWKRRCKLFCGGEMRIIKRGKRISYEVKKECDKCATIFAITSIDTRSNCNGEYVFCPNCHKAIRISEDEKCKMMEAYGN